MVSDTTGHVTWFGTAHVSGPPHSNWASVYAQSSYEPELVHDIIDSDEEQCYDHEDDSNGNDDSSLVELNTSRLLWYTCFICVFAL